MKTFLEMAKSKSGDDLNIVHITEDITSGYGLGFISFFKLTALCGYAIAANGLKPNGATHGLSLTKAARVSCEKCNAMKMNDLAVWETKS